MSPRNQDDANCKSGHFPVESDSSESFDFTPNILHKKHKVIKLVKAQLLNLQGLFDSINSTAAGNENCYNRSVDFAVDVGSDDTGECMAQMTYDADVSGMESRSHDSTSPLLWLVILLMAMFITLVLAAWLSAGPLSNRALHTPIHWSSLVKTDGICELERKYLLRWSTSNHLE